MKKNHHLSHGDLNRIPDLWNEPDMSKMRLHTINIFHLAVYSWRESAKDIFLMVPNSGKVQS